MDYSEEQDIVFLDVANVEGERERREILQLVRWTPPGVRLPWKTARQPQKCVQPIIKKELPMAPAGGAIHVVHHQPVKKNGVTEGDKPNGEVRDNVVPNGNHKIPTNQEGIVENPEPVRSSWAGLFRKSTDAVATPPPAVVQETNNNSIECPFKNARKQQKAFDPDCYRLGEFLVGYTVEGRITSVQPRGLINQSNYCYINSILQALIACPPMYNLLNGLAANVTSNESRKPTPVIDAMCRFVREFKPMAGRPRRADRGQKSNGGVVVNCDLSFEASWIYKLLNGIQSDLVQGRQEDAEEFLGCLLNALNDEMLELIKLVKSADSSSAADATSGGAPDENDEWLEVHSKKKCSVTRRTEFDRTPISDIFGGFLKSRIHRAGDHVTENIQPFFTLQLNIETANTVAEALEGLVTKYQLEGVTSSKTNEEVEAWQQVLLDELPVCLIMHLKCFDFKPDGCRKILKALEFPFDLRIDPKLLSKTSSSSSGQVGGRNRQQYKLFAVVYHEGKESNKGHYITDAYHVGHGSWVRYDDASVRPVTEDQVARPQGTRVPYLLFYRRTDAPAASKGGGGK